MAGCRNTATAFGGQGLALSDQPDQPVACRFSFR
jgi:hypothetical protein